MDNGDVLAVGGLGSGGGSLGIPSPSTDATSANKSKFVMKVTDDKVGAVIGQFNDNLRYMQSKSGAQIHVSPPHDGVTERTVYIEGSPQCIAKAQQMITKATSEGYRLHQLKYGAVGSPPKRQYGHAFTPPATLLASTCATTTSNTPAAQPAVHLQSTTIATPAVQQHLQANTCATTTSNTPAAQPAVQQHLQGTTIATPAVQQHLHGISTMQHLQANTSATISATCNSSVQSFASPSSVFRQGSGQKSVAQTGNLYQGYGTRQPDTGIAATDGWQSGFHSYGSSGYSGGQYNDNYFGYGAQGQHYTGNYLQNTGTQPPTGSYWGGYLQYGYQSGLSYQGAPPDDYVWRQHKGGGQG